MRGIHKAETKLRELICDDKMRADILILTELKSRNMKAQRRWLQSMLPNYKMHLSEATCSGVMVAVCRELLVCGESTTVPTPKGVADNLVHVQIPFPNAALHILGVYSATSTSARKQLYEVCSSKLQSLTDSSVLLAGDFNATLQDRDRVSGKCYNADKLHRQFVASCNLHPTENPASGARAMSYFQGVQQAPCSRIDDILCSQPLTQAQTTTVALAGDLFDHAYVKATLQYDELGISPNPSPSAPLEPKVVLQTPLTKADTAKLSAALTARQPEWTALAVRLSNIVEQEVRPHWRRLQETDASRPAPLSTVEGQPARQLIDQLGEQISTLLLGAHGIAMEVCTTRRTNPSGLHFRPRAVSRRRKRLVQECQEIRTAIGEARRLSAPDQDLVHNLHGKVGQIKSLDKQHSTLCQQDAIKRERRILTKRPKMGNKIALRKTDEAPNTALRVLRTGDGTTITDPKDITAFIEATYRQKTMAPGVKTGRYLPEEVARDYPFEKEGNFAEYHNTCILNSPPGPRSWLHSAIDDDVAFRTCLKSLARGKAPGPDGVTNEVLQALPPEGKTVLHHMIRLMWATGLTPVSWKQSHTVLLFKQKGTPLELTYYRRIGLESTVYKLWTRMVSWAMADRAERQDMLSAAQGGFRNKRMTAQQLEMMAMVLEDAHSFGQDIFLLQADLTEAFDTIDQDKLLMILYDLGFPCDVVDVVKDLYTNAHTTIQTPHGPTQPIPLDRGTIQGDSLSPFLFILYIEPLLRWLHARNKGYHVQTLSRYGDPDRQHTRISSIAFADDINVVTGGNRGKANMQHQARKVESYSSWGRLGVNNVKTTITGALYNTSPSKPYDEGILKGQLQDTITMQGKRITYHPLLKPFRHLGVLFTMDLNFKPQWQAARAKLSQQVEALAHSYASTHQKRRIIETCMRPALTYAFSVAPYSKAELRSLDALLTKATKKAFGISATTSTALAHEDTSKGGLGCHSLEVEYNLVCHQRLVRALNDTGVVGAFTKASLAHQTAMMDALTSTVIQSSLRYCLRLRQLMAIKNSGHTLRYQGCTVGNMRDMHALAEAVHDILPSVNWNNTLIADLHTINDLGVHGIAEMLDTTCAYMRPVQDLENLVGKRNVRDKHRRAWNRVTYALCLPSDPLVEIPVAPVPVASLPQPQRKLRPNLAQDARDSIASHPRGPTITTLYAAYQAEQHVVDAAARAHARSLTEAGKTKVAVPPTQPSGRSVGPAGYTRYQEITTQVGYGIGPLDSMTKLQLQELLAYYGSTPQIVRVEKLCTPTPHRQGNTLHKRIKADSTRYAMVHWAESIMPGWCAEIAQTLGYKLVKNPERMDLSAEQYQTTTLPCELCTDRSEIRSDDVTMCKGCARLFHKKCSLTSKWPWLGLLGLCRDCQQHTYTPSQVGALSPSHVQLAPSLVPIDMVAALGTPEARLDLAQLVAAEPLPPPIHGEALDTTTPYDVTLGQSIRKKLTVNPSPVNPQLDCHHTGRFEAFFRDVPTLKPETEPTDSEIANYTPLGCVTNPAGTCTTMSPRRLAQLHFLFANWGRG